eukprot:CAMPEP_0201484816 /NCGR_PEP_ID=MMETSP0151_2-20130828/8975_1 /ASSEMBLY_ACC=CAM_ASM_000257 /TAXON_ID=200890 /ORGANISM="Paramoeba atlantica, Strain 621/1 / CCAP 1560/9" /LENGTH=115 /DNA_ID=CAMNT_0047868655 /DNA_START=492 /DNA_END=839 /DNA_ORIENTATION=+
MTFEQALSSVEKPALLNLEQALLVERAPKLTLEEVLNADDDLSLEERENLEGEKGSGEDGEEFWRVARDGQIGEEEKKGERTKSVLTMKRRSANISTLMGKKKEPIKKKRKGSLG